MSRYLAFDVDHGSVHVAAGTARSGAARIEKAITITLGEALTPNNAADLGKQLRDALKSTGIQGGPAVAVVGRDRVIVKDFKIPKVSPTEEPNVVRFQASKEMTEAPESVALDYFTLERPEPDGQIRVVAASVRKDLLAAYKAFSLAAGLKLTGLTARPLGTLAALDRAIASGAATAPEAKRASVAILSRGDKWSELVIARDGQAVFWRAVSATALTSEPMLLGELRRNLAVYNGQNPQQPVESLYVVEAAGPASGWSGRIQAGLSIQVQAFDPLADVEHETSPDARGQFAAIAGLLQLKTLSKPLPVNFVSPRQPVSKDANKRKWIVAATSLAALLVIGGLIFGYIRVEQKQAKLTALIKEKSELEKQRKEMEEDEKRMKAFKEWDETRINWLDQMYDLAAMFPDINSARLVQLQAEPHTPPKGAKIKDVGRLTLKIQAEAGKYMDALSSAISADRHYHNPKKDIKGGVATASSGRFKESYELRVDIEKRPSSEFVRKLAATAPAKPARGGGDSAIETGAPFGGGFGGGGFGGGGFGGGGFRRGTGGGGDQ